MNIFVLNRGSSSIKASLYSFKNSPHRTEAPLWEGQVQWKNNFKEPFLKIKNSRGVEHSEKIIQKTPGEALKHLIHYLFHGGAAVLNSEDDIQAIGHRIVHGGRDFSESTRITPDVKRKIRLLSELAPLHNLPELEGIEILEQLFKNVPQVAVFDTAFHHTLPEAAKIYAGPYKWYEEGIQRYGFHGISFQYCSKEAASFLNRELNGLKMVICHLGSGASLCAIQGEKASIQPWVSPRWKDS